MKKNEKNGIFEPDSTAVKAVESVFDLTVENPEQQKQKSAGFSTNSAYTKFDMRRHMASCVLSTSKHFQYLKITCPFRWCEWENAAPKSRVFGENIR